MSHYRRTYIQKFFIVLRTNKMSINKVHFPHSRFLFLGSTARANGIKVSQQKVDLIKYAMSSAI